MERLLLTLAIAGATYAARVSGFALTRRSLPASLERFLANVPVAVFAALIAPDVVVGGGELAPRLIGIGAATLVVLRVRQLWAGLAAGMACYWIIRLAVGGL